MSKSSRIERVHGIYRYSCPNCRGEDDDIRLNYKAPCKNCLEPRNFLLLKKNILEKPYIEILRTYYDYVKEPKELKKILRFEEKLEELEKFFGKATGGYRFWSAQRTWARRILKGKSFSIIAPTGMGKTTFALVMALYYAKRQLHMGKRVERDKIYLVFPTTPLLVQAERKLKILADNAGLRICGEENEDDKCIMLLSIHGKVSRKKREEYMEKVRNGDFDILLTTNMFMHKHYDILLGKTYKFITLDDVDAILRSSKAIRILFKILGISDEEIDEGIEYLRLRQRLAFKLSDEERREIEHKIKKMEKKFEKLRRRIKTIVLVSSATGRPRGIYPRLFKILLGFEAGSRPEAIRNIVDTYIEPSNSIDEEVVRIVSKLGDGGLVFVPIDKGIEYAENLAKLLSEKTHLKVEAFHARKGVKLLDAYASGEIDVLVGVATYYGVMVRGLDLPDRVKYAVFPGVPRHKFSSRLENPRPIDIIRILSIIRDVLEGDEKRRIELLIGRLSVRLRRLSQGALMKLTEDFQRKLAGEEVEETPLLRLLIEALKTARELLAREDVWEKLKTRGDIALIEEDGKPYILIPDVATYIQASGRTSRLYPGGITKGLSIVIVDDKRLLNGLVRRMRWLFEDFDMKPLNSIDLDKLMKEISEERVRVAKILRGELPPGKVVEITKSALMIVESPNKARTIANFFGKPSTRILENGMIVYDVATGEYVLSIIASIGHVYDLAVDVGFNNYGVLKVNDYFVPVYTDIKKCNKCGYQFTAETRECPKCGSRDIYRKLDVVDTLRELAGEVDLVLIGTDPDTEGEKIGYDLKVLLEPYTRKILRIEFHEVTRKAILNALKNPREFDLNLVEAQIVRRIEDRWLGFALSQKLQEDYWPIYCSQVLLPMLMSKIRKGKRLELPNCCRPNRNLSAGRVQTPVLGYIIERFNQNREPKKYGLLKYVAILPVNGVRLRIEFNQDEIEKLGLTKPEELVGKKIRLREIKKVEDKINPPPPFTTDTLLQEASIRLGLTTTRTMEIAQELFELGLITYHRTDSTRISEAGIAIARQYLEEKFGDKYKELFQPRTWGMGGAHEAIRPTRPIDADRLAELIREGAIILVRPLTRKHLAVYRLIFNRFIASQMKPAIVEKQYIEAIIDGLRKEIEWISRIIDEGFNIMYPVIKKGEVVPLRIGEYSITEAYEVRPPLARYHDVIRWMKEQGIGRPSTYAKIIQTLIDRRYVNVVGRVKALAPTERGIGAYRFLTDHFPEVVSVQVTRNLEEMMKKIEEGKLDYQEVLHLIYDELKNKVLAVDTSHLRREVCGDQNIQVTSEGRTR